MAGWKLSGLFKKTPKAPTKPMRLDAPPSPTVVQPLVRDTARRSADTNIPRFQSTASDQPSGRSSDRLAAMRSKVRYAFTPSQPVADRRMFAGRNDVLQTIIHSIEDQRLHVVIYGERGIGKTSLLHMLTQAASEARYIVIYTSCGANSDFDDTFRAAAADIPVLFHRGYAPTTEQAEKGASLADLLPEEPVTPRQFADLCAKLTGTRVLIVLDEFDRCETVAFRRDVAELIKNLSDRIGRVQLVLAGVAGDLSELVAHIPSIRRNIFAFRVPKMPDREVLSIVSNGEREVGFAFEPAARDLVVAVSRGSPYIANLLCHHAGYAALEDGRTTVMSNDVAVAVDRADIEFQSRIPKALQSQLRRLVDQGHGMDLDIAARTALSSAGSFSVAEVQEYNQVDTATAERALKRLADEGLLVLSDDDEAGPRYEFPEEGLPTYLWISSAQQNLRAKDAPAKATRRH